MQAQTRSAIPFDIISAARRIEERQALQKPVGLHLETGETLQVTLTDLSTRGCRVTSARSLPDAMQVTVSTQSTLVGGRVSWSADHAVGIEFNARLLPRALRNLSA